MATWKIDWKKSLKVSKSQFLCSTLPEKSGRNRWGSMGADDGSSDRSTFNIDSEDGDIHRVCAWVEQSLLQQDGKNLPNAQHAVLYGLLTQPNWSYEELATGLEALGLGRYKPQTLKNDAYNLFKRLSDGVGYKVKKNNLQRAVMGWHQKQKDLAPLRQGLSTAGLALQTAALQTSGSFLNLDCWQDDLAQLVRWVQEGRRVLGISGAPRIGKTYFVHALCDRLQPLFEAPPIWCSAPHVSTPAALYQEAMRQLGEVPSREPAIPALMELFRSRRLLFVMDGTEVLFQPQQLAGHFKDMHQELSVQDASEEPASNFYLWLKQLLAVPTHQSCLLWVGRELPVLFEYPRGVLALYRVRPLQPSDALALLESQNAPLRFPDTLEKLLQFCGGNPAWLLMAIARIKDLYEGDSIQFLASPSLADETIKILELVVSRVSKVEQGLLIWLLIQPLPRDQLLALQLSGTSLEERRKALFSLQQRGLIQKIGKTDHYHVDPPLLGHVLAQQIVAAAIAEIVAGTPYQLGHYPWVNTAAPPHLQAWQQTYLLGAIARQLHHQSTFRQEQLAYLQPCLEAVRQLPPPAQGYAAGNLFNLAAALKIPLTALNFDGLTLCHADLRQVFWNQATLSHCTWQHPQLPTHLRDGPTAALSPDGTLIAAADQQGHLLCWQHQDSHVQLHAVQTLGFAIDLLICPENDTLLFVANQAVYSWFSEEPHPQKLTDLPEPATCLTQSLFGKIAIGMSNGSIGLLDPDLATLNLLEAHQAEVCNMAFSPDGWQLASLDSDNRVVQWQIPTRVNDNLAWQELPTRSAICFAVSWDYDKLLRAESSDYHVRVRVGETCLKEVAIADEIMMTLQFTDDGRYLVGTMRGDRIFHWAWQSQPPITLDLDTLAHAHLATPLEERWVLVTSPKQLRLMDVERQELLWEACVASYDATGTTFRNVTGLSPMELDMLASLGIVISD